MSLELKPQRAGWPGEWLVPDWPAPANVRAVFTTRHGGVSNTPYDSLNLGEHVGDTSAHVAANRAVLARATGVRSVFFKQVHGTHVAVLDTAMADGCEADACLSTASQLACTMMVADCLPVLLCTEDGSVVAAAHAGWRGLAGSRGMVSPVGLHADVHADMDVHIGVLESVHAAIQASVHASFRLAGQQRRTLTAMKIIAWLGPCIGPDAFEVGPEVKTAFESVQPNTAQCFSDAGADKYMADLSGLARLRLQALGVTQIYGNNGSALWCTTRNPSKFFSHRRDAGVRGNGFGTTGRMAAVIWRE